MSLPLIIYHGGCPDGFGSAYLVWKKLSFTLGDGEVFVKFGKYDTEPPLDVALDKDVYVLDFSYSLERMEALQFASSKLIILDHHLSAERALKGLKPRSQDHICFDKTRSGVGITFDCFYPGEELPEFFKYIQDRDLWTHLYPDTDFFYKGLLSFPFDFKQWDSFSPLTDGSTKKLIEEGKYINRYCNQIIREQLLPNVEIKRLKLGVSFYEREVSSYVEVPVVNCTYCFSSDVLNILAHNQPAAISYACDKEGYYVCSIRSVEGEKQSLDVSKIAEKFGGGGHKHAAGFRVKTLFQNVLF